MSSYEYSSQAHQTLADTRDKDLTRYQLRQWGFVIIRATYSSESKWAEFLAIVDDCIKFWWFHPKNEAHSDLYDKHVMTVLEDAATLSDANLSLTARVFADWVNSPQAQAEREGTKINDESMYSSRYHFYIHVDGATIEQVLDQHAKRTPVPENQSYLRSHYLYENKNLFTVKVVNAEQVMMYQEEMIAEQGPDANINVVEEEVEEEEELRGMVKRVRIFQIPELYAVLGDSLDMWYNLYTRDQVCEV
ncbi:hypothetical protein QBC37DRAFT_168998 [Rhypophila decipiens]|uniref:Uncharacterized protein n=1 Tax=Rhypophila decipiens TaxID=261697 RepID=A0AAN6Y6X9_9PEZI|nr:hypothetical protein QBC37DRAFT_168998 [Rhypophila decipiens]